VRRLTLSLLAGALALAALVGCAADRPAGVDADLTDDWPAMAAAVVATPAADSCYHVQFVPTWTGDFADSTVPCDKPHWTETLSVGTFSGSAADRSSAPPLGSKERAAAYADCATEINQALGASWQTGYLSLNLTLPDDAAWRGGARWYRCEIFAVSRDLDELEVESTGSAVAAMHGDHPAARTCQIVRAEPGAGRGGTIGSVAAVSCDKPHNVEFAGLFRLGGSSGYPDPDVLNDAERVACFHAAGQYIGVAAGYTPYLGIYWNDITEEQWALGIRTGICYVIGFDGNHGYDTVRFTGSVKGIGNRKPTGYTF